jgi:hypothetical protein
MKHISEILKNSDAYKRLEMRRKFYKELEDKSYKYCEPIWFEIQKDDNPEIWDDHLQALSIEESIDPECESITLKVSAYYEGEPTRQAQRTTKFY